MKKAQLILLLLVFSLKGTAQTGQDTALRNLKGPQLKFVYGGNNYDFGRVPVNSSMSYEFQFKNSGDEPLLITDVHHGQPGSQGNIQITWPRRPVKPGRSGLIIITYTAKDEIGSFKNDIYINSNATPVDYALLHLTGAVTPVSDRSVEKAGESDAHAGSKEGAVYEIIAKSAIWVVEEARK